MKQKLEQISNSPILIPFYLTVIGALLPFLFLHFLGCAFLALGIAIGEKLSRTNEKLDSTAKNL